MCAEYLEDMQVYEIMKEEGPRDRLGDRGSLQVQAAPRESVSHRRNSEFSYSTGGYSGDFVVTALVAFGQLDAYPFFCTCRFSQCLSFSPASCLACRCDGHVRGFKV